MAGYFFGCPHCRAKLEARDASRAGKTVTCPKCEQSLIIPPPPKMGVALSQSGDGPLTAADEASQVVVSHDPGFKRPMSPAKAYSEGESLPSASSSGTERLTRPGSLDNTVSHIIEAGDDVEGYSFTLPDNDSGEPAPPPIKQKKPKKKTEEPEAPHPFEDPKNQLFALLGVVLFFIALTTWLRSGGDDKDKEKPQPADVSTPAPVTPPPSAAPQVALPAGVTAEQLVPTNAVALPGSIPGVAAPGSPLDAPMIAPPSPGGIALPGGNIPPDAEPETPPAGTVPNVLPGAADQARPGSSPRTLPPGTTPNALPEGTQTLPNPVPAPAPAEIPTP